MSKNYGKVPLAMTLKEAIKYMHDNQQKFVLVVDEEDFLEGILTYGDVRWFLSKKSSDNSKSESRFLDVSSDELANFTLCRFYLTISNYMWPLFIYLLKCCLVCVFLSIRLKNALTPYIKLYVLQANTCLVSSVCTRGISYRGQDRGLLICYPDTELAIAKQLMEAKGIKQLPVVTRGRESLRERKRRILAVLHYDSILNCLRFTQNN